MTGPLPQLGIGGGQGALPDPPAPQQRPGSRSRGRWSVSIRNESRTGRTLNTLISACACDRTAVHERTFEQVKLGFAHVRAPTDVFTAAPGRAGLWRRGFWSANGV